MCPVARSALHSKVAYTAWVPLQAMQTEQQQEQPAAASTAAAAAEQLHHSHIQQPHTAAAGGVPAAPPPSPAAPALTPPPGVVLPAWTLSPRMLRCALLLSPDEELGDEGDLFIEQAVIAVSVSCVCDCRGAVEEVRRPHPAHTRRPRPHPPSHTPCTCRPATSCRRCS